MSRQYELYGVFSALSTGLHVETHEASLHDTADLSNDRGLVDGIAECSRTAVRRSVHFCKLWDLWNYAVFVHTIVMSVGRYAVMVDVPTATEKSRRMPISSGALGATRCLSVGTGDITSPLGTLEVDGSGCPLSV